MQVLGTAMGAVYGLAAGLAVYGLLRVTMGIRLGADEEHAGADISIHGIGAYSEEELVRR